MRTLLTGLARARSLPLSDCDALCSKLVVSRLSAKLSYSSSCSYAKVCGTARFDEHGHDMIEDNVKSDDDTNCRPEHAEIHTETFAQHLGNDGQEDIGVPPHQVVHRYTEERSKQANSQAEQFLYRVYDFVETKVSNSVHQALALWKLSFMLRHFDFKL